MDEKIEEMVSVLYPYINAITPGKHRTEAVEVLEEKSVCEKLYNSGYRKESDTARECLEQFICRLVNARLVGVNDDLYYELLEAKDDLLKEKYGVDLGE